MESIIICGIHHEILFTYIYRIFIIDIQRYEKRKNISVADENRRILS